MIYIGIYLHKQSGIAVILPTNELKLFDVPLIPRKNSIQRYGPELDLVELFKLLDPFLIPDKTMVAFDNYHYYFDKSFGSQQMCFFYGQNYGIIVGYLFAKQIQTVYLPTGKYRNLLENKHERVAMIKGFNAIFPYVKHYKENKWYRPEYGWIKAALIAKQAKLDYE